MAHVKGFHFGQTLRVTCLMVATVVLGALLAAPAKAQDIKTETIEYHDDLALWIVGQPKRTTINGIEESKTDYGWKALPGRTYSFGKPQQTFTYDGTSTVASGQLGTLKTVKDGKGNTTTLTGWKRGIPQAIKYGDGKTKSAVANDDGTIAQVTDENGFATKYQYDAMGRLALVDYPDGDTVNWTSTVRTFSFVAGAYGLPNHWRLWEQTGGGFKLTHYDALWRPIVEDTYENGNAANTRSIVVKRYDAAGRLAFQSYPIRALANWTDPALKGTSYTYDALDRIRTVTQNSELGPLTTTTDYLSNADGYYTQVRNPRGYYTRTWYQAYDQPGYDLPRKIQHASGYAYTDIARDPFGKPTSITRRNGTGSIKATRKYTYNSLQELCRTDEPETGSSFMGFDAAGNLAWSASGYSGMAAGCVAGNTVAARRVDHTYDARNRLVHVYHPDGLGNVAYTYTPDGLPASIVNRNDAANTQASTITYAYNRRRLLEAETLVFGSVFTWPVDYAYNTNGHLSAQVWHGLNVDYAPNALGQPTKAGTFATGVSYHPNGAIKQFTYGNGITHILTQNVRGLPDTSKDAYGTTAFLSDGYDYDQNGNVAAITDGATGRNQRGNRTMAYDGLDRLTSTTSPMFGTATYAYDVLDNLTRAKVTGGSKPRDYYYCYNGKWQVGFVRLGSVCTGSTPSQAVWALGYDPQGNLAFRDNVTYAFDFGNRLRGISSPASTYAYDGLGRRVWDRTTEDKYSQYLQDGRLAMTADERAGKVSEYVYLQGSLVAIRERNTTTNVYTTKYQHTDALGSPVVVTGPNRGVDARTEYEPYGRVTSPASPQDGPGYTGHVYDAATGLVQMQQRYYDPILGRFLSVDPVTAYAMPGVNFNRYWYANNNPYGFIDPDGRQACGKDTTCQLNQGASGGTMQMSASSVPTSADLNRAMNAKPQQPQSFGETVRSEAEKAWGEFERLPLTSGAPKAIALGGAKLVGAGILAFRLGKMGEDAVRAWYAIGGRELIVINGRLRIPDGINRVANTINEVKNVGSLSLTRQIRDYIDYARATPGMQFNLFVRPGAQLSGPLRQAEATGDVVIHEIPF